MRALESIERISSIQKRCNDPLPNAMGCTETIPARVARAIWDTKTAEKWAAEAGVQPRMAKYWLAGYRVSPAGRLALIRLLT